jgi:phosphate transport system permease protein
MIIFLLTVAVFLSYLLIKGIPSLGYELIFGQTTPFDALLGRERVFDGLFPAIVGTFFLIILSTAFAIPLGICSGIYLAEYANPKIKTLLGIFFDILAGVPSIVIGLFGFGVAIFLHNNYFNRFGPCLLVSAVSLAILVLPYITRSTQASLENLPPLIRKTGMALGANKIQNLVYLLIPNALSGITSGIILAVGRCAEDTAVILLTGVVATAGVPSSLLAQYEALPFYIYYISNQYSNQAELNNGYGACLILLGVCIVLFMTAYGITKHLSFRTLYRA